MKPQGCFLSQCRMSDDMHMIRIQHRLFSQLPPGQGVVSYAGLGFHVVPHDNPLPPQLEQFTSVIVRIDACQSKMNDCKRMRGLLAPLQSHTMAAHRIRAHACVAPHAVIQTRYCIALNPSIGSRALEVRAFAIHVVACLGWGDTCTRMHTGW